MTRLSIGDEVEVVKLRNQIDYASMLKEEFIGKRFIVSNIFIQDGMPVISLKDAPTGVLWPIRCFKKIKDNRGYTTELVS